MIKELIKNSKKGFTLIELLIVVAIIGILATLLMVNFIAVRQRARDAERKSDLRQIQSALELYRSDNGSYPSSLTNCTCSGNACLGNSTCSTIYMQKIPVDPNSPSYWNTGSYYYSSTGETSYVLGTCLENSADVQGTATSPGGTGVCGTNWYFVVTNP
jgi:type II secretion system protein G